MVYVRTSGFMTEQGVAEIFRGMGTHSSRNPEETRFDILVNFSFLTNYNSRHFSCAKVQKISRKSREYP